jgi:hypothetical protein
LVVSLVLLVFLVFLVLLALLALLVLLGYKLVIVDRWFPSSKRMSEKFLISHIYYPKSFRSPQPPLKRAGLFHSKKEKSGNFEISLYFD